VTDEEAIRRTLTLYCHFCDDGRFDEWSQLYTDDATFTVMGRTYRGRDDVKGFIEEVQPPELRGKHVLGQMLIDVDPDSSEATVVADYTFVTRTPDGGHVITSAGRYHDTLLKHDDGRWLFASREIRFLGD
jgi:uncharacterized protein (TIGR02246 family)